MIDGTKIYDHRAVHYAQRPGWSLQPVQDTLRSLDIPTGSKILEFGSGNGNFSSRLIQAGMTVIAVEPNKAMREESLINLKKLRSYFTAISGTATQPNIPINLSSNFKAITASLAVQWWDKQYSDALSAWNQYAAGKPLLLAHMNMNEENDISKHLQIFLEKYCPDYACRPIQLFDSKSLSFQEQKFKRYFEQRSYRKNEYSFPPYNYNKKEFLSLIQSYGFSPTPQDNAPIYNSFKLKLENFFEQHSTNGYINLSYKGIMYKGLLAAKPV